LDKYSYIIPTPLQSISTYFNHYIKKFLLSSEKLLFPKIFVLKIFFGNFFSEIFFENFFSEICFWKKNSKEKFRKKLFRKIFRIKFSEKNF